MKSAQKLFFPLNVKVKDLKDALLIMQLKGKNNQQDVIIVELVHKLYKKIIERKSTSSDLTLDDHFELAKILVQARNMIDTTPASICVTALRNVFGGNKIAELQKHLTPFKKLKKETFLVICQPIKKPTVEEKKDLFKAPVLLPIPRAPRKVAMEDLTDSGRLKVTCEKEIFTIIEERLKNPKHKSGRVRKDDVLKRFGKKPTCSALYFVNDKNELEVFWLYKGKKYQVDPQFMKLIDVAVAFKKEGRIGKPLTTSNKQHACGAKYRAVDDQVEIEWVYGDMTMKHEPGISDDPNGRLAGAGGNGSFKIAQKHVGKGSSTDFDWHGVKIKLRKKSFYDTSETKKDDGREFKVGKKQGSAIHQHFRYSPSHEDKLQEEIVMKWEHGDNLDNLIKNQKKFHPLFLLHIIINIFDSLIAFYDKHQSLHRDLKPANIMIFGLAAGLIDFDSALKWTSTQDQSVDVSPDDTVSTAGFFSKKILTKKENKIHYDIYSEMYSLGILIALVYNFITKESKDNFEKYFLQDFFALLFSSPPDFKIQDVESSEFKSNKTPDELKLKTEILKFTHRLIDGEEGKSPIKDIKECPRFFRDLAEHERKTSVLRVCFINVDEFISSAPAVRQRMLVDTEKYHVVQLIKRSNQHTPKQYMDAERQFNDLKNLIGKDFINLVDYPVSELHALIPCCSDWYPIGKNYEFHYLDFGALSIAEAQTLSAQKINHDLCSGQVHGATSHYGACSPKFNPN